MTEAELIRAQRYHERAKALQKMARAEENPVGKNKLLGLAEEYQTLCDRILKRRIRKYKISGSHL
jgi:hypothetical protein